MSNPCGCGESNSTPVSNLNLPTVLEVESPSLTPDCQTTVHKKVCVQAQVTITPKVTPGPTKSFCHGKPMLKPCSGKPHATCTFTVSQKVCVQIPLAVSASVTGVQTGIDCDKEKFRPCSHHRKACTHKIRYFKKHPEVIERLIKSAGGSIVLGKAEPKKGTVGASFIVTTANAMDVLTLKTPSPPSPGSSPLDEQYRKLYAQLLTANLNVLNGASCSFATSAISAANQFLADSPSGIGIPGATIYTAPLSQFNFGKAPGCPCLCKKTKKMSQ